MSYRRDQLKVDELYFEESTGSYFVTPDCVGIYWFDSMEEVNDQYGEGNFTTLHHIDAVEDY